MILIGVGSNLPSHVGDPAATLRAAIDRLSGNAVEPVKVSPFYRTPAWPNASDPFFTNAVLLARTDLAPTSLLKLLKDTEKYFGRVESPRNAPRTLDLDILDYDGRIDPEGSPVLPHPRMAERAFVLVPLFDVAPDWVHPVTRKTIGELVAALPKEEQDSVRAL